MKYGAASQLTLGRIVVDGCTVRKLSSKVDTSIYDTLHQQIEVFHECLNDDFAKPGDSGALVLLVSENAAKDTRALGLVVGGTSYKSVIITPIWSILDSFNLPPNLLTFEKT